MIKINNIWYKGRLVFDFDGVICVFGCKDYSQAVPFEFSIDKINKLFQEGWYITICTARYMERCKGNIEQVHIKGYNEGITWLRKFGVLFHRLVLGKPSGDIYVDDRACRVEAFKGLEDWENNFDPLIKKVEENNANL